MRPSIFLVSKRARKRTCEKFWSKKLIASARKCILLTFRKKRQHRFLQIFDDTDNVQTLIPFNNSLQWSDSPLIRLNFELISNVLLYQNWVLAFCSAYEDIFTMCNLHLEHRLVFALFLSHHFFFPFGYHFHSVLQFLQLLPENVVLNSLLCSTFLLPFYCVLEILQMKTAKVSQWMNGFYDTRNLNGACVRVRTFCRLTLGTALLHACLFILSPFDDQREMESVLRLVSKAIPFQ